MSPRVPLAAVLVVMTAFVATVAAAPKPQAKAATRAAARALELHVPISRTLLGAGTHRYQVALAAGDFVHVTVVQHGVDVAVALVDPDGREAIAVDASDDPFRAETLSAVVDRQGAYTIVVRRALLTVRAGRYSIELDEARPATDRDRTRVEADRAFERGRALWARRIASVWPEALRDYETAVANYRSVGDRVGETKALIELANAQQTLGRSEALASAERAESMARELDDEPTHATAVWVVGRAQERAGDLGSALRSYESATALSHQIGDTKFEATSLNTEGIIWGRRGDPEAAAKRFERALPMARATNNRLLTTFLLNNLAYAYSDLGEHEKALGMYEQALANHRASGDRIAQAGILVNISNVENALHRPAKAVVFARQSLAAAREVGEKAAEATALNLIGISSYELGDYRQALEYHRQSLAIRQELHDRSGEASSLEGIGRASRRLGDFDGAAAAVRDSLAIRRQLHQRQFEADALRSLAEVERDRGDLAAALTDVREAVDIEEARRRDITSSDARASFVAGEHGKYELLVDLLQQEHAAAPAAGHDAEALQAGERARARVLLDSVVNARVDLRDPAATQAAVLTAAEIQSNVIDDNTVLLEFAMGESRSWLWAVTRDGIWTTELPPRDTIAAAARSLYERFTARQPRPHETSDAYARRVARADQRLAFEAAAISRMLFGGISAQLRHEWRGKRLAVVAAGALEYLPFAALPLPEPAGPHGARRRAGPELLIADHELVSVPSASVIAALRRDTANRMPAPKSVAIVADPVFDPGDPRVARTRLAVAGSGQADDVRDRPEPRRLPRLPFSREEANAIASLVDPLQASELTDFSANRAAVLGGALAGYRVVHFATHGVLDTEHPTRSGLVLSQVDQSGAARDGELTLRDIYTLRLGADLVVLSACQTALGKAINGEGLIGLARAFMAAGAPRVVASLWQVSDVATAELMKQFYRGVLDQKLAPAAALRAAQLAIAHDARWRSPYYWAGFVLQGDWK